MRARIEPIQLITIEQLHNKRENKGRKMVRVGDKNMSQSQAGRQLGITKQAVAYYIKRYGENWFKAFQRRHI